MSTSHNDAARVRSTAPQGDTERRNPPNLLVSWAIDYNVQGSKRWDELTETEQDEYLVACFESEATRAHKELKLGLYDRAAGSIADHLLGVYRQFDGSSGTTHYSPPTPRIAARVLELRSRVLSGTILGARLEAALRRIEGKHAEPEVIQDLIFYSVAPSEKGMEILDEECSGDTAWGVPIGFNKWNNFDELDRLHYRETSARWKAAREESIDRTLAESQQIFQANAEANPPAAPEVSPVPAGLAPKTIPDASSSTTSKWVYAIALIACAGLAGAFIEGAPYWYFTLLRMLVCSALAIFAFQALIHDLPRWASLLGVGAIIYNPLLPLHLGRELWQPVNIATVALLVIVSVVLYRQEQGRRLE